MGPTVSRALGRWVWGQVAGGLGPCSRYHFSGARLDSSGPRVTPTSRFSGGKCIEVTFTRWALARALREDWLTASSQKCRCGCRLHLPEQGEATQPARPAAKGGEGPTQVVQLLLPQHSCWQRRRRVLGEPLICFCLSVLAFLSSHRVFISHRFLGSQYWIGAGYE